MITKPALVELVREKTSINKRTIEEVVNAFVAVLGDKLAAGEEVRIKELGTFHQSVRSARKGRNPQTGEEIDVPETNVVRFKLSAAVSRALNA
uniref:DNA binding protein n=1 Tax=Podoviridae sp. ctlpi2 TaxID=2826574 RepID=A0A8S5MLI1_9CAUD|nr:MAG TPA: DNA binding protein [Podoviridae sp. ctlpi2]